MEWYCGHPDVHSDTDQPGIRDYLVASEIDELIRTSRHAVVVGIGNVALDVARVLIKTVEELDDTDMADEVLESLARKNITDVHVLGRRGPAYTAFTTKELREMGQLPDVDVIIDAQTSSWIRPSGGSATEQGGGPQSGGAPRVGDAAVERCIQAHQFSLLESTDDDHRE